MKLTCALALTGALILGISSETPVWSPGYAAQPTDGKGAKAAVKRKKLKSGTPQTTTVPQNVKPQGSGAGDRPSNY